MPSVGWRKAAVRIGSLCPVWCRGVFRPASRPPGGCTV